MPVETHEDIQPAAGMSAPNVVETHEDIQPAMGIEPAQEFDSARTSRNQVPALFNHPDFSEKQNAKNIDIGGGRFDKGTEYLRDKYKITSKVFDPFNRTEEHNDSVHNEFTEDPADMATVANVLNVIKEPEHRINVIKNAHKYLKPDGEAYFSVYEGNGSGLGSSTRDGWQENRKLASYLSEVKSVFPDARISRGAIIARKKIAKAYGGAIPGPKLTEENVDEFARRLILWSYAAAPLFNRSVGRADGGQVNSPDNPALDIARGVIGGNPAEEAVSTARSLTPMGFYSAASEAASKIPQKAPIDQILNKVKGQPNVKAEELDWSGVRDAFAGQKSVDPKEVARHFQENLPQIQETVKGDPAALARMMHRERQSLLVQGRMDEAAALKDKITETYDPSWRKENAARYDDYTIPDGENYREVLLHLPQKIDASGAEKAAKYAKSMQEKYGERWSGLMSDNEHAIYENIIASQKDPVSYQSSHWNVPNVVAHLRMSDRREPMGGKILHVEEMQSDWGQDAREHGIKPPDIEASSEAKDAADKILSLGGDRFLPQNMRNREDFLKNHSGREAIHLLSSGVISQEEFNALRDYREARYDQRTKSHSAVPPGPHVTSTESWTDLALKRALREAAEGGYKKLVWTPGKDQAERYDLSNQVKHVMWSPDNKILSAITHDGSEAVGEKVEKDDLHKYLGKEVASRLLEQEPEMSGNMATHHLRGQDLSIGGEGMRGYYDRLVPQRLKKLVSKLDPDAKFGKFNISYEDDDGDEKSHDLHSLEITPRMRAAILKGLPAYERGGSVVDRAFEVLSKLPR